MRRYECHTSHINYQQRARASYGPFGLEADIAGNDVDIFFLTSGTQFSLHSSTSPRPRFWSPRRRLLGNERRQLHQVFDTEVRATGRRPHEWIRRRHARPCCRQVSKSALVITKTDAVFSPSQVLVYELELAPAERMKDMRNQEGLRPIKRYECS